MKHQPDCGRPLCEDCRALRPRRSRKPHSENMRAEKRANDLAPDLMARMDAEEAEFNRLRDMYGPYGMSGAAGDAGMATTRTPTGRAR